MNNDPMTNHKCRKIADANCGREREMWLGELLEPIVGLEGDPPETHCLHIKTPFKEVVFGINMSDAAAMAIVAYIIHGQPFNPHWLESMEAHYRKRAEGEGA
jgi:hypothetical protein